MGKITNQELDTTLVTKLSNSDSHIANTSNPHGVTASQVGAEPANANIQTHISSTSNPHAVTRDQIGSEQKTNWIINGQFDVWQRGTSQTNASYGSDDRWVNFHAVSAKTTSRQEFVIGQTEVPNNPTYFSRTDVVSGNTASSRCDKIQSIEDVTRLAGKIISLSFWAKANTNKSISIDIEQYFGTGGSALVVSNVQKFSITPTWQRFTKIMTVPSIVGKTIGTNNYFGLHFWFDAGSDYNIYTDSLGNQSGTFDIANVCLVEGSVPVECPNEPYAEVLRKCQRYYQRFETKISGTDVFVGGYFKAGNATIIYCYFPSTVPFRVAPTAVDYSSNVHVWDPAVGVKTLTGIILYNSTLTTISLGLISNSAFTTGAMYLLAGASAGSPTYIGISAEL